MTCGLAVVSRRGVLEYLVLARLYLSTREAAYWNDHGGDLVGSSDVSAVVWLMRLSRNMQHVRVYGRRRRS